MATGKYEAAIEDFNAALNVNANNSEAWAGLGLCYEKLNNHAKAVESYQRAVTVNPGNSEARAALQRLS
jgi:tetratricopeptide (TPR) repeat protein